MPTRNQEKETEKQNASTQKKINQLMNIMRSLITRINALKTKFRSITFTLLASTTFASLAPQPQSTQSNSSKQSQQKRKRNEKTRQQYKRKTL